jgi:hypothetical protein
MSEITTIRFDGDNLQTVREGERVWVVLKRACEALGLDAATQAEKLKEKAWAVAGLIPATGPDGRNYEMFCVDMDTLPMWLATIDVGRVKEESRAKLITYQRECARVLRDHFFGSPQAMAELRRELDAFKEDTSRRIEELKRENEWLKTHASPNGCISASQHRRIRSEVKSIAAFEVAAGMHKNQRAASASLYKAMGELTGWGGNGAPWSHLPVRALPYATRVLDARRKVAERAVCNRRQLRLVPQAPRPGVPVAVVDDA